MAEKKFPRIIGQDGKMLLIQISEDQAQLFHRGQNTLYKPMNRHSLAAQFDFMDPTFIITDEQLAFLMDQAYKADTVGVG